MLKSKRLSKKYGKKTVVKEVDFHIPHGKITSLIGPNGAGKSTVLNMIARLIERESGDIMFKEKDVLEWNSTELAKNLSILKQSNSLYLKLTIKELVEFGRFPYSKGNLTAEDREKVDIAIEYMELDDIKDRYLDELSGGQRQRAYIAMVIAQDTEYLMLDEPLNNIDIKHSKNMMRLIRKLCNELHKTVILVMHDLNFASCYSDYIIAFKDGKILKAGNAEEVMTREVLEEIYELPVAIHNIEGRNICVYY
ncbi:MAG: ATP-binding cassette domain-containing protein [Firmicutes bacterium]|nr:ATP-binding cassette domain-containing protein [Bacillota bacterium]